MVVRWLLNALALLVVAYIFPGWLKLDGLLAAVVAALVLGIVNAVIRPVVLILTLPLNLVTLGLFTFVVNALMLILVAWLVPGVDVGGFWPAVGASLAVSIVSGALSGLVRH